MNPYLARSIAFFFFVIPGFWYFLSNEGIMSWLALGGGFLLGGIASHLAFKRFATPEQIREDLTARLFND